MPRFASLRRTLFTFTFLGSLAAVPLRAHAQEPTDNDLWKARCLSLSAQAEAIDKASAPPELLQTTHGIPGSKFAAVAHGRGDAGQHYIACTLYYTGAMAERQGNGGKVEAGRAHTYVVLGGAEAKRAAGLPLSFKEKMDRTSGKLNPVGKGSLTPADLAAVYSAFEGGPAPTPAPAANQPANTWDSSPKTTGGYNPNAPLPPTTAKRKPAPPTQTPQSWPQH